MKPLLVAVAALHVDVPDEPGARAILDRFAAAAGVALAPRVLWAPYDKLGPHSRLTFYPLLRDVTDDDAVARLEALCAVLVAPDILAARSPMRWQNDDGTLQYERVVSANVDAFRFAGAHWFDVELNTYDEAQADVRRAAGVDTEPGSPDPPA